MRRKAVLLASLAGGSLSLAAVAGLGGSGVADGAGPGPTTSVPVAGASQPLPTSPRSLAVAAVLAPGSTVRSTRSTTSASADYEQVDADGPSGNYQVTIYNRFEASELDGAALKRSVVPGGLVWIGAEGGPSTSIYFLSSDGVGLRIGHNVAKGKAASVPSLQGMAQRLLPLMPKGKS